MTLFFFRKFAPRCCVCRQPIMPEPGKEETVRVVALDRSFHVSCYKCEVCEVSFSYSLKTINISSYFLPAAIFLAFRIVIYCFRLKLKAVVVFPLTIIFYVKAVMPNVYKRSQAI